MSKMKFFIALVFLSAHSAWAGSDRYLQCTTELRVQVAASGISGLQGVFPFEKSFFARSEGGASVTQINQELKDQNEKSISQITVQGYLISKKAAHVALSVYNAETGSLMGTANGVTLIDDDSDGLNEILLSIPFTPVIPAVFDAALFGLHSLQVETQIQNISVHCKLM